MRKKETTYIKRVTRKLSKSVYHWKIHASFENGVPDSYFSGNTTDLWVEFKWLDKVKTGVLADLSPLQQYWLNARYSQGRNIAVIVGTPIGSALLRDAAWNNPICNFDLSVKDISSWINKEVGHD